MPTPYPGFRPRAALVCFLLALVTAVVGFSRLPFVSGYFVLALVAGGVAAIGWIIVVKSDGRIATGYLGLVAMVVLNLFAKKFLPSGDSSSIGYPFSFAAVAIAVGLGAALVYRQVRKQKANQSLQPTPPSGRG
jgi:hypothetical protein